jgi:hypothetical protein
VCDPDDAERLATSWLRWKWSASDTGSEANRLMPFPPERHVPASKVRAIRDGVAALVKARCPAAEDRGHRLVGMPFTPPEESCQEARDRAVHASISTVI